MATSMIKATFRIVLILMEAAITIDIAIEHIDVR